MRRGWRRRWATKKKRAGRGEKAKGKAVYSENTTITISDDHSHPTTPPCSALPCTARNRTRRSSRMNVLEVSANIWDIR